MDRRGFLVHAGAAALLAGPAAAQSAVPVRTRSLARSGERIPVVGMGTWMTFNLLANDAEALAVRGRVLERFFAGGGSLIDSSPMYGSAEGVLGQLLPEVPGAQALFSATKVWTPLGLYGPTQMERSLALWGLQRCDLMQIHNLLNWEAHIKTLRQWQAEGRARHIGVTTSHGNKHDTLREVLAREPLDTLQITYNPADQRAEPLMQQAADRGMAVILNRPFDGGRLLDRLQGEPLPASLAADLGCTAWAPLVLKWELAHPAVTCVIPATTNPEHMSENLQALRGPLPDRGQRELLGSIFERVLK
ncbi:aldo/keto reductase [Methylibium sp.]|uniref:aldo/keto reductase n=1 Tax=Methylibium sp. TaxID=2067992 RepID=UPI0025D44173|nr:aldo/keto reductase [Methylibium sp.]